MFDRWRRRDCDTRDRLPSAEERRALTIGHGIGATAAVLDNADAPIVSIRPSRRSSVGLPLHDRGVLEAPGTLFAVVILIPVGFVDDFFRDNLLDDVFEGHNSDGTALFARSVTDEEQVGASSLAEDGKVSDRQGEANLSRTSSREPGNS